MDKLKPEQRVKKQKFYFTLCPEFQLRKFT